MKFHIFRRVAHNTPSDCRAAAPRIQTLDGFLVEKWNRRLSA